MRFHLRVQTYLISELSEVDRIAPSERLMDELHALEHRDGRRECTVGVSQVDPGRSLVEIDLYVDGQQVEVGFAVGMEWLRTGCQRAGVTESQFQIQEAEIVVEDEEQDLTASTRRPSPRQGAP